MNIIVLRIYAGIAVPSRQEFCHMKVMLLIPKPFICPMIPFGIAKREHYNFVLAVAVGVSCDRI